MRERTTGSSAKLYSGGGEGMLHSSVAAPHGLGPAIFPRFQAVNRLKAKTSVPTPIMNEPIVASMFISLKPMLSAYVKIRRGIP